MWIGAFVTVLAAYSGGILVGGFGVLRIPSSDLQRLSMKSKRRAVSQPVTNSPEVSLTAQVALTREAGKNSEFAELLHDVGIATIDIPCIAHEEGPDASKLPQAIQDPDLTYVVITSPEAAKVFIEGWKTADRPYLRVACVGNSTGEVLQQSGIQPVFSPSKANGKTLVAELPFPSIDVAEGKGAVRDSTQPPRVLYPASARAERTIEDGLTGRGFSVHRLNTYNTVSTEWDDNTRETAMQVDVVAFASPSAVKTWASRVELRTAPIASESGQGRETVLRPLAACIGSTSAKACRLAGWTDTAIFYPKFPGIKNWVKSVQEAIATIETQSAIGKAAAST